MSKERSWVPDRTEMKSPAGPDDLDWVLNGDNCVKLDDGKPMLYSPAEPPVQDMLRLHDSALSQTAVTLDKVARKDSSWALEDCDNIVRELEKGLQKNRRFLLFACKRAGEGLDVTKRTNVLAAQAVHCCVGMLGLAMKAGASRETTHLAGLAGLVQNFGLALIPEEIVNKQGKLSHTEREKLNHHPTLGAQIPQIATRDELAEIVSQARERVDGSGYPRGLKGDQIHPIAQLLHAVDVFVALGQPRAYRTSESPHEAMRALSVMGMKSLSPKAVRPLLEFFTVYPVGSFVKLNTGEQAKVVETNSDLLRPVVAVLTDALAKPYPDPFGLDLSKGSHVYITRVVDDPALETLGAHVC